MNLLIVAKIVHLLTVIIFMGCVFFRTFTLPKIKKYVDIDFYQKVDKHLSVASRSYGVYNALVLLISGTYLAYFHYNPSNILLIYKIIIAVLIVVIFWLAPLFVHRITKKHPSFKQNFHWAVLSSMFVVVVISQLMFT